MERDTLQLVAAPLEALWLDELRARIAAGMARGLRAPRLAVLLVGDNPESMLYVSGIKQKKAAELGLGFDVVALPGTATEDEVLAEAQRMNADESIDAYIVQLPLPSHVSVKAVTAAIDPRKDADANTPHWLGRLAAGWPGLRPCTPAGVMRLLGYYGLGEVRGKRATVVGASATVGMPMALLLQQAGATVTICDIHTRDLAAHTRTADLVVSATGAAGLLGRAELKEGCIAVNIGMKREADAEGKMRTRGDLRVAELQGWAAATTPVLGSTGPLTVCQLMENAVTLWEAQAQ